MGVVVNLKIFERAVDVPLGDVGLFKKYALCFFQETATSLGDISAFGPFEYPTRTLAFRADSFFYQFK